MPTRWWTRQSIRPSFFSNFGAYVASRSFCGSSTTVPAWTASRTSTSRSAPVAASWSSNSGVVASGGTGTRATPSTGPASIFSTTFTMQTPVTVSPRSRARATGSGPR